MNWGRIVRKALERREVLQGIAQVASSYPQEHIRENYGRGASGDPERHKPLKTVTGQYWARSVPKGVTASGVRRVSYVDKKGKTRFRTEYLLSQTSYRAGGQPLRNTGNLLRSMSASAMYRGGKIRIRMRGLRYGLYQDRGFKTSGPNYIPLTRKGVRDHGTGNNPNKEGLARGKDYTMAWRGVTVPARPFILPTKDDVLDMGRSVFLALKRLLRR